MNREDELHRYMDDVEYTVIWNVSLDEDSNPIHAEIYRVMDMARVEAGEWPIHVDHRPSDEYIANAIEQLKALDWSEFEAGSDSVSAISYVYRSNPNMPICSNDQRR